MRLRFLSRTSRYLSSQSTGPEIAMSPASSVFSESTLDGEQQTELLEKQRYSNDLDSSVQSPITEYRSTARRTGLCGAFALCVPYVLSTILLVLWIKEKNKNRTCTDPSQGIFSPAQDVIEYETRVFAENFVTKGPYMGAEGDGIPTNETDRLWEELYQCKSSLHVTSQRLIQVQMGSLEFQLPKRPYFPTKRQVFRPCLTSLWLNSMFSINYTVSMPYEKLCTLSDTGMSSMTTTWRMDNVTIQVPPLSTMVCLRVLFDFKS